jgi:hypothetical protein
MVSGGRTSPEVPARRRRSPARNAARTAASPRGGHRRPACGAGRSRRGPGLAAAAARQLDQRAPDQRGGPRRQGPERASAGRTSQFHAGQFGRGTALLPLQGRVHVDVLAVVPATRRDAQTRCRARSPTERQAGHGRGPAGRGRWFPGCTHDFRGSAGRAGREPGTIVTARTGAGRRPPAGRGFPGFSEFAT